MGSVKKLSDELASKIAAGEVIERPASIVKELMENAIDAGADSITITLKNGGIDFIRVEDNGDGILSEDLKLAVQRHTTSKLYDERELYEITTLGFRGEALYSIGVISQLEITSKHKTEDIGASIVVKGGHIINSSAVAHTKGTIVNVSNLFFNTPARKKFLSSPQAEYRACLDVVDRFVFGRKNAGIRLIHNSKEVFNIQSAPLDTRIMLRIDPALKGKLYNLSFDNGIVRVEGFISDSDYSLRTTKFIYIFVNGRYIIDKSVSYTIINAYSTVLQQGRYPVVVVNLYLPPHFVDVNVDPTKTSVKFSDKPMLHNAVGAAVKNAINKRYISYSEDGSNLSTKRYIEEVKEAGSRYMFNSQQSQREKSGYGRNMRQITSKDGRKPPLSPDLTLQPGDGIKGEFSSLNIYGQFNAAYIIASSSDRLVLVDQHAMHERIIFEQLLNRAKKKDRNSQFLVTPRTIFLNENRMSILTEIRDALHKIGYDFTIEKSSIVVRALPAETSFDPLFLIELIDDMEKRSVPDHTELIGEQNADPLYRIMAGIACKSAVKAGDFLTVEKIKMLFARLDELGIPLNCPHGRPFVFILPQPEIEKYFHRR